MKLAFTRSVVSVFVAALLLPSAIRAADHRIELLDEAAPVSEVGPKIAELLATTGVKIVRGTSRTVCEIWLCKQWSVDSLEPAAQFNYPFRQGQLMGAARFPRKGGDFRDQDVEEGVYTLRYAQMPVDGAHVGVSPTRDFLLLVAVDAEKSTDDLDYDTLAELSAEAVGSSHPGLLSMKKVADDGNKAPSIRHDEENDWWLARLAGKVKVGDEVKDLSIDLVVVGFTEE